MYSGKAIEGRYFIAVCDLRNTKRDYPIGEYRLTKNGDNWREGIKAATDEIVSKWNAAHPDRPLDLNSESVRHVHYAMKHRSREKGFILTHSFEKCRNAVARYFASEAIKGGYLPPKEKRDGHGRRRP